MIHRGVRSVLRIAMLLVLLITESCAGTKGPAPANVPGAKTEAACVLRLPAVDPTPSELPPTWEAALSEEKTRTEIVATIEVSASAIAARLASEVPAEASATNVNVGAAGLLTYSAHRSPFAASKRGQSLHFTTQISAQAEVCKPLGPLGCISYASCQPAALADASVGLEPGANWSLGPSRVALVMTRPCVLGPIDATHLIQRGANQQAAVLRAKLDKSLPSLRPQVGALWKAARFEVSLSESRWRYAPTALAVGPASLKGEMLSYPVAARGRVALDSAPSSSEPDSLPAPLADSSLSPGAIVRAPIPLDVKAIERQLVQSLDSFQIRSGRALGTVSAVEVFPTAEGLRLVLEISGSLCGRLPLILTPFWDEHLARIRFSPLRIPLPTRTALSRDAPNLGQQELETSLQERLALSLSASPQQVSEAIGKALEGIRPQSANAVEASKPVAQIEQVLVAPNGLLVLLTLSQEAHLLLR